MLFTIGSILLIFGVIVAMRFQESWTSWNKIELVGVAMYVTGAVLMASSIWILTWKYLP